MGSRTATSSSLPPSISSSPSHRAVMTSAVLEAPDTELTKKRQKVPIIVGVPEEDVERQRQKSDDDQLDEQVNKQEEEKRQEEKRTPSRSHHHHHHHGHHHGHHHHGHHHHHHHHHRTEHYDKKDLEGRKFSGLDMRSLAETSKVEQLSHVPVTEMDEAALLGESVIDDMRSK